MRSRSWMLITLLGMNQRQLINPSVGAHVLGSDVTPFHTSAVRALTDHTWSCHLCSLPMDPATLAQAGAFTSSMRSLIIMCLIKSHRCTCLRFWPHSLLIGTQTCGPSFWLNLDLSWGSLDSLQFQLPLPKLTYALSLPWPPLSPWTSMVIWTPGQSQLASLELPYHLLGGSGMGLANSLPCWPWLSSIQPLGSSWPPLASQNLALKEWSHLPSSNSWVPLGSSSTQGVKNEVSLVQLVNGAASVSPMPYTLPAIHRIAFGRINLPPC